MIKKIDASLHKEFNDHESVFYFEDSSVGLRGYLAIHSTKNGPATGGTRVKFYEKDEDAISDVLRLSNAMTLKCNISQVPFGGGKSVIICDPKNKSDELLRSYGRIIDSFEGNFTTGTDMGLNDEDILIMRKETKYVLKGNHDGITTSQMAAQGVFSCMEKISPIIFNKDLKDLTVSVKGLGKLGGALCLYLDAHNVKTFISDTDKERLEEVHSLTSNNSTIIDHKIAHKTSADIFSPCALGNEFTPENIDEVTSSLILGGANNQLLNDDVAVLLHKRNIWYIPDFIVNAGGLIHIVDELGEGGYNSKRVLDKINLLAETSLYLVNESIKTKETPLSIAYKMSKK